VLINELAALTPEQLGRLDPEDFAEAEALVGLYGNEKANEQIGRKVASFNAGPLLWLTQYTKTENPQHGSQGLPFIGPFPRKPYFVPLFEAFLKEKHLLVPKSRTMMTSWSAVGYATWRAQWHNWDCIIQTDSLDKVKQLMEYASQLYRYQPDFLKAMHPLETGDPLIRELRFARGGRVMSIPSGANKWRVFHPSLSMFDELAFMEDGEQAWNAALPAAQQMIGISSAQASWFGDECTEAYAPKSGDICTRREYPIDRKEVWER